MAGEQREGVVDDQRRGATSAASAAAVRRGRARAPGDASRPTAMSAPTTPPDRREQAGREHDQANGLAEPRARRSRRRSPRRRREHRRARPRRRPLFSQAGRARRVDGRVDTRRRGGRRWSAHPASPANSIAVRARAARPAAACAGSASSGSIASSASASRRAERGQLGELRQTGRAQRTVALPLPGLRRPPRDRRTPARPDRPRPDGTRRPATRRARAAPAPVRPRAAPSAATQEADPGARAAPHPPAQLVQLREPEAIRLLDDHHRRVRDVDPQLDDGGRHQHVGPPVGERAQRPLLLRRGERPVQEADARRRQRARGGARAARRRSPRPARRAVLPHRTDDERLAPLGERVAEPRVGGLALARRSRTAPTAVGGGRPPGRSVRNEASRSPCSASARLRGIGVADMESRCGAPAGAAPRAERAALSDAEAVLLVDDHQAEPRQLARDAEQRLRPDQELRRVHAHTSSRIAARAAAGVAPVSAASPIPSRAPSGASARSLLLGQHLGRHHHERPGARRGDQRRRAERHRGLPAANVARPAAAASGARRARSAAISSRARACDAVSANASAASTRARIAAAKLGGTATAPGAAAARRRRNASCATSGGLEAPAGVAPAPDSPAGPRPRRLGRAPGRAPPPASEARAAARSPPAADSTRSSSLAPPRRASAAPRIRSSTFPLTPCTMP